VAAAVDAYTALSADDRAAFRAHLNLAEGD
jgi:hypothetical protein